jgi:predicted MFS family arabinose efflux permease
MQNNITQGDLLKKEKKIIFIAGLIQFINVTDFMMVMPLGPDFMKELGIASSKIGLIGGSYTFAAAIAGLMTAFFLDNFQRRRALLTTLMGLILSTAIAACVWNQETMVSVRLLAGAFGGPLTALALALIADKIPPERRGQAMGKMMGGFAAASVLGVPFGLELAQLFSWRAPFLSTALIGSFAWLYIYVKLEPYPCLSADRSPKMMLSHIQQILLKREAQLSYVLMALTMSAGFIIIPNISPHLQMNLHYPREKLGLLYMCGGAVSFFSMRLVGISIDKWSATFVVTGLTALLLLSLYFGFSGFVSDVPVITVFIAFMVSMSGRSVCSQTLSSKVPSPEQRGAYMALQSSITHFSSAFGAYYASLILIEEKGLLLHVDKIAFTAIALSIFIPLLVWFLERKLNI